jgi:hypothetical protein
LALPIVEPQLMSLIDASHRLTHVASSWIRSDLYRLEFVDEKSLGQVIQQIEYRY